MISIKGRSVFGSIARGKLTFYHRDEFIINKIKVSDPELEYKKYVKAKNAALVELGELYDRARLRRRSNICDTPNAYHRRAIRQQYSHKDT